ncbi:ABC transporter permease [Marinimicrobium sp. ARAG 43.8]|uniref:ABC transporter permease n=1 Tax=Marinimicrobium sp. ARAG 43.8 TaxID=3418719 RepID=UPI003CF4A2D7
MSGFLASLRKELSLLLRDWHALLLLFAMPTLFILIMSLALQEHFDHRGDSPLGGRIVLETESPNAQRFIEELQRHPQLKTRLSESQPPLSTRDDLFEVKVLATFDSALEDAVVENSTLSAGVEVRFAPELPPRHQWLIAAGIREAFGYFNTLIIAEDLGYGRDYAKHELLREHFIRIASPQTQAQSSQAQPSAVQQSVSAWLIFAMFFIAIPISTTVVQERQNRTLMRLHALGVSPWHFCGAKLLPYLAVNLLQLTAMLAIGTWLLPLLGAQGLSWQGVSVSALAIIGLCTSLTALSLASLIAALARSVEQATVASGAFNILAAALGGIMVPAFVMPPPMQTLSLLSPLAWSLDGFLEVLVRGGGLTDTLPNSALMLIASGLMGLTAVSLMKRGNHND